MRNPSRKATATTMSSATTTTSTVTSSTPCCSKVGLKRGPWTPEEDELLSNYIKKEGEGKWRTLPKRAGLLRCGKSCRLRWMNYLRPNVKRGQISDDEEDLILRLHRLLGNRWSLIAGRIPGRTDNEIKNYWNTHLSKKLISQGIDPRTHKPLMNSSSSTTKIASFSSSKSKERRNSASSSLSSDKKDPNDEYHHNNNNSNKDHVEGPILIIAKEDGNNNNNNHFLDDQIDDDHDHDQMADGYTSLLMDCDDHYSTVMPKRSNNYNGDNTYHQRFGNEEDENMMNNYYSEDAFSSFLNSLINEDDFTTSQHHHRQLLSFDPMISNPMTAPTLGFGAGWESPMISSSLNHSSDLKRVNNDDNVDG